MIGGEVSEAHENELVYEPPSIEVIGPVEELTLGSGGTFGGDANSTYEGGPI
jgi:hypothetical protein